MPTSGINLAASQQKAQQIFSQFAPDVSGGTRQVAIMLTDQATGPDRGPPAAVARIRQSGGRSHALGQEFAGIINNNGRVDGDGTLTNYKDHGFGFALGLDAGSAQGGWYGGALSFYTGDVSETLPRAQPHHTNGTCSPAIPTGAASMSSSIPQARSAYGNLDGNRTLFDRQSGSRRRRASAPALMGALGATTGVFLNWGRLEVTPHIGLDGLAMREEGYTEKPAAATAWTCRSRPITPIRCAARWAAISRPASTSLAPR